MRKPSIEFSHVISLVNLRVLRSVAARTVFPFFAQTVILGGYKRVPREMPPHRPLRSPYDRSMTS
jgi:hypothetical protein